MQSGAWLPEKSLLAARDHVFLTWHDITFSVPNKRGGPQIKGRGGKTVVTYPDGRSTILSAHAKSLEEGLQASRPSTSTTILPSVQHHNHLASAKMKTVLHSLTGYAKPG